MFQSLNLEVEKAKAIEKARQEKRLENIHLKSLKRYHNLFRLMVYFKIKKI